eukprot:5688306-Amphidinium_carterae.1
MAKHYAFLEGDTVVVEPLVPALRWLLAPTAPVMLRHPVNAAGNWIPRAAGAGSPETQDTHRAALGPTQRWIEYSACHYRFRNELNFGFIPAHGGTFASVGE